MHHHGHHRRHFGGRRGRLFFRGPFPNRQELLERLEGYQRDLEQELADVSDVIAHLRDQPGDAAPAEGQA
ncbi:MAG TPA: hypothetical protein VGH82_04655 [Gaiellaceae bacterium]|jgi:hypothetical protein